MKINNFIKNNILILDGAMGTVLQSRGLCGKKTEIFNISHPDIISGIHYEYLCAGSDCISTNTFGANLLHYSRTELEEIIPAAVRNAKNAVEKSAKRAFVALDIGPTGRLLKPFGDLEFEEAVSVFAETVRIGAECGVDCIFIETMNDLYETKAAVIAAKENSSLPVFVSNAYSENGKLLTGAVPETVIATLEGLGADAIGVNCSFGPDVLMPVVEKYLMLSSLPVIFKPNAGMPEIKDGKTVFGCSPEYFGKSMEKALGLGVRIAGGCCGTNPDYIRRIPSVNVILGKASAKKLSVATSGSKAVVFSRKTVVIGERINPTGKKRLKQALRENDINFILGEAVAQQDSGADILDVNAGLPEINEEEMLPRLVSELQAVTDLPLQIDSSDPKAMEKALRLYNGKAIINSVNGKRESMDTVFPLAKKYGGLIVCLTLDENGIPETADGRITIAEKIISEAEKYGIGTENLIFDTLTMTVTASKDAARVTLDALKILSSRGFNTVLGVSNVSFGLPNRELVNSVFLADALENGLSAAIMNPCSEKMMGTVRAHQALSGLDPDFSDFISAYGEEKQSPASDRAVYDLKQAVLLGFRDAAGSMTRELLKCSDPLAIIEKYIMTALDEIGDKYEKGIAYLPQLLMSAEAASRSFDEIKRFCHSSGRKAESKGKVVLATVKGDVHDIGKNIVKLLLENYGFEVIDLGKDVSPEAVIDGLKASGAKICGLSALMTTTVKSMEETIALIKEEIPECKTVVGGAVLTREYAKKIGADRYSRDAMDTVNYCREVLG